MNKLIIISLLYIGLQTWSQTLLAEDQVDYLKQVKHLLSEKCYSCHSALKQEAGLRLETKSLMLKSGDNGAALVPGNPSESLMFQRIIAGEDEQMPPLGEGTKLNSKEIAILKRWIEQGAKAPDEITPGHPRDHWAFQPPGKVKLPPLAKSKKKSTANSTADLNPIDRLLAIERSKSKIVPNKLASKQILLRRIYLDLIGLPPTREEQTNFLEDNSEGAYRKVVVKLLSSPQHGERWGRHWMDIWRYSDWYGLNSQLRYSQKHLWHWRDWIIESLNQDKGYDVMIEEMLAADEIAPTDQKRLRATGFLARHYYLFNRTTWLDGTIEHTSKAFLGLTMNCTKCHDHKYDPISQADYYRMRAIFEPYQVRLDAIPGETNLEKNGLPRIFDAHADAPTYLHIRGNPKTPDEETPILPGTPKLFTFHSLKIAKVDLPLEASRPALRTYVVEDHLRTAEKKIQAAQSQLSKSEKQLANFSDDAKSTQNSNQQKIEASTLRTAKKRLEVAKLYSKVISTTYAADLAKHQSSSKKKQETLIKEAALATSKYQLAAAEEKHLVAQHKLFTAKKADDKTKKKIEREIAKSKKEVDNAKKTLEKPGNKYMPIRGSRKALESPAEKNESRYQPYPNTSTGRRTAFAQWITDRKNPLTARVAVNHIWLRHFGQPLVENVTDFGLRSKAPVQQKLLDWLAVDFMEHDWSMKHLHERIVTSKAYQISSSTKKADAFTMKSDADNHFFWRRKPIRMESEVIRDSLLHLANSLDTKMGGPSIDPNKKLSSHRRSLYLKVSRDHQNKFTSMFDAADILSCYRRDSSVIPQQALALANSKLAISMASKITKHIQKELLSKRDEQFITIAFETILSRIPTNEERVFCLDFIEQTESILQKNRQTNIDLRVRENLVHAIINHNDFITIR